MMTNEVQPMGVEEPPRSTGEWIRSLLVVGIAAAIIVGIGVWFVFSFILVCGCTKPA